MMSYLHDQRRDDAKAQYPAIESVVRSFLDEQADNAVLHAPFRLTHGDFDGQNLLFTTSASGPPKLTGVIDWEASYTGTLYYLFEYPIFMRDNDMDEEQYDNNRVLRKHFVQSLAQRFSKGSPERRDARETFRQKSGLLNQFRYVFMTSNWEDESDEYNEAKGYKDFVTGADDDEYGAYNAYGGKLDWEPDSELESDEDV
jgi:aminoglycoside phosphotransferase (APT) family kinase protein